MPAAVAHPFAATLSRYGADGSGQICGYLIDTEDVQALREASEEFSVVLRDMSTLQERIKLLQEEIAAQVDEDDNRSLFVLTVVTVICQPFAASASSSTSIQCRTGVAVPVCRCWMQPMLADTMVSSALGARWPSLRSRSAWARSGCSTE